MRFALLAFWVVELFVVRRTWGDTTDPRGVVGGSLAPPGKWPDVVAVLAKTAACSGTLIAPDVVLTAGHCIEPGPVEVVVDSVDYADRSQGVRVPVKWARAYPLWDRRYDIGVVMLEHPAPGAARKVAAACTARERLVAGAQLRVVGFGLATRDASDRNTRLREATVPVIDASCTMDLACEPSIAPHGEFIAGGAGSDACFGDSGGPIFVDDGHGPAVIGVVSRGVALPGAPCGNGGVYVRVDKVVSWIQSVTGIKVARTSCEGPADQPDREPDSAGSGGCATGGQSSGFVVAALGLLLGRLRARRSGEIERDSRRRASSGSSVHARSVRLGRRHWRCVVDPPDVTVTSMATANQLAAAFAAARADRSSGVGPPAVGARLVELCAQAHAAFPELLIDDVDLVTTIGKHSPTELGDYLERCRAADLAVATLAARGSQPAIAALEKAHRTTIESTCRRFAGPGQTIDDLRQILRAKLFVAEPPKQPKIADYAGQGFLDNWLRVTAVRVFLDLQKRKDRTRERPVDDDDVMALPQPGDLALDVVKSEYRAAVTTAMHEAARLLEPGDRHLLRQHLVVGLSIDQLAPVLGIHRATAARRIARAREHLVTETRRQLVTMLKLDERELDEVIGLVMSRLDVSIGKLLASREGS